jgi:formylglycine-generating enzyme required for sulfatase activity
MSRNGYRLPTEIEWLFAANERRLHLEKTYSGSFFINDVAWYLSNSNSTTHPVAGKQGNSLGLFDMSGNVWEWIWDWSSTSFPNINAVDPTGPANPPASGSYRVQRGGSYMTEEQRCRLDHRGNAAPHVRRSDSGFRIVRRGDISER